MAGGEGWRKTGEDVRMGEERHGCWGIDAPGCDDDDLQTSCSSLYKLVFLHACTLFINIIC